MNISHKVLKKLNDDARMIRHTVFEIEQGFVSEFDDTDETAHHVVLYIDGAAAAVGRTFPTENAPDTFKIGRVAVLKEYRGKDIGREVMKRLEDTAKTLGAKHIALSAQLRARGFYEKLGYNPHGEVCYEEDCPHIKMQKDL